MKALVVFIASAFVLTACGVSQQVSTPVSMPTPSHTNYKPNTAHHNASHHNSGYHHSNQKSSSKVFTCDDIGLDIKIDYLNSDNILLTVVNDHINPATLTRVPSASGVQYATHAGLWGYGATWHEKNNQAVFEYGKIDGKRASVVCQRTR